MILTGKAKEDFENWLSKSQSNDIWCNCGMCWDITDFLSETALNSFIIEWFDTVDIYITTTPFDFEITTLNSKDDYKSYKNIIDFNRTEVQKISIEKANEIYNARGL